MIRDHYIAVGAIVPDQPTKWTSNKKTLKLDQVGREMAQYHIYEHEYNQYMGLDSEIPLDQVPQCVLEYWEENGRLN